MADRTPGPLTRQQLYDLIRESSKDEYILSEMKRLGFWPDGEEQPSLPEDLIQRKGELERRLRELVSLQARYKDPERAIAEMHKKRKAEALQSREETRQRRNRERFERSLAWHERNQKEITHLGEAVSAGLSRRETDRERLEAQGLPLLEDGASLAESMGIGLNELRFLSYSRKTSKISHYQHFLIEKKTGGVRRISAPMPRLKRAQYWILANILEKVSTHEAAHGFLRGRSIVSNATPHVNSYVVVNSDIQDFFPTIDYPRVKGLFRKLGYSEHLATILALLCTEPETDCVELDGETYFVAKGDRHLPQGAPTSPMISNLVCRRMDKRLSGVARSLGMRYTRYADDMTFSGDHEAARGLQKLLWRLDQVVSDEGFTLHPKKTRVMRSNNRQEVTGVVVNRKLSVDRKTLRRFRALLHQIERDGPEGKCWGSGDLFLSVAGYANFVAMVNPERGIPLQQQVATLRLRLGHAVSPTRPSELGRKLMRIRAAAGEAPRDDWWQPAVSPPPVLERTPEEKAQQKRQEKTAQAPRADDSATAATTNGMNLSSILWKLAVLALILYLMTRLL